jgi:hypothetical protein
MRRTTLPEAVPTLKKGNYKEAASAFEKALQLSPNNDPALGRLA